VIDPLRVHSPALIMRGQWDGIATDEDVLDFFQKLPNPDRQFVVLPGIAHQLNLSINRFITWHVAQSYLSQPEPLPIEA
jgi:pimeloyl-ACP methyl ester carboxylesterase